MKQKICFFISIGLISLIMNSCKNETPSASPPPPKGWISVGGPVSAGNGSTMDFAIDANDNVYVAYRNDYDYSFSTPNQATVKKYENGGWVAVGGESFSDGSLLYINIALDSTGVPYVGYADVDNGWKAYVMKYTGNTETDNDAKPNDGWEYVGSPGFSESNAYYLDFVIDSADNLYAAYNDPAYSQKLTVMKYTGNTTTDADSVPNDGWEYVGSPGFSIGIAGSPKLAFDSNNIPYIIYRDDVDGHATVKKYQGGSWQIVGSQGFSGGDVYFNWIAFDSQDNLYASFRITGHGKAVVMRYTGNTTTDSDVNLNDGWEFVGEGPGLSPGQAPFTSIAFDSNDTPYLAFRYEDNGHRTTVMKYTGNAESDNDATVNDGWEFVGKAGFAPEWSDPCRIIFDSQDIPYVGFGDGGNGSKATVMKFYE
jgi:hypothetical protein